MKRALSLLVVALFALVTFTACSDDNNNDASPSTSQTKGNVDTDRYDKLTLECEILSTQQIAEVVGGPDAFARGTFFGAICRWVLNGPTVSNVTFNWFEWGNLNVEKDTAKRLGYQTENIRISSQTAFTQRDPNRPSVCGVTARAPSRGIFTWWVEPRGPAPADACAAPIKLMELVLSGGQ